MVVLKNRMTAILACALFLLAACDKTERATSHFIKEGRWVVTQITAGTTEFTKLPKWQIYACDDHENFCTGKWEHQMGSFANFYWQFSNLGGDFTFYADSNEADTGTMAYAQCFNLSGDYKVMDRKSKSYHFESTEVVGYPGKLVTILIEKE